MLRKKELLDQIGFKLAHLKATVATLNELHFFDLNVVAEDFFAQLLNLVYGYSLVNLNHSNLNEVAVDLGDDTNRLAVQVTSQRTLAKIQKTLNKFSEHGLSGKYDSLKVLIIGDRTGDYPTLTVPAGVTFSGTSDVIDIPQLTKDIGALAVSDLERIAAFLRDELKEPSTSSPATPPDQIEANQRELLRQHSLQSDKTDALSKDVNEVRSAVTALPTTLFPDALASVHQGVLDTAKDLLKENKPSQALSLLERQRNTIWATSNGPTKARLLCILAGAHLANGDEAKAAHLFLEARQHNPDDEKVLANVAVAYLLLNAHKEAVTAAQDVLNRNPANVQARSVLIQASDDPLDSLVNDTPDYLRNNAEVATAIGAVARRRGDLKSARQWLDTAVANDSDNHPDINGMLAEVILHSLTENPTSPVRFGYVDKHCRTELELALRLFQKAIDAFADESGLIPRISWLLNAAITCRLLGEQSKSDEFLARAMALAPHHTAVVYQRAVAAREKGDTATAIQLAQSIKLAPELPNGPLFLAQMLWQADRMDEAISELQSFLDTSPTPDLTNSARQMLIEMFMIGKNNAEALRLCGDLISATPLDVSSLVIASQVYRTTGQKESADATLEKALRVVTTDTPSSHLFLLGNELGAVGRWSETADVFKTLLGPTTDTPLTRKYLHACYQAGKFDEALAICTRLRETHGAIDFITELEIAILEEIGDLPSARSVCEVFVSKFPNDGRKRVQLAVIYFRQQDASALDAFLNNPPAWQHLPVECGQQIAHLYLARRRQREAIALLYDLRRTHSTGKVHLQYLQTFLFHDDHKQEWLNVTEAAVDVAVRVTDASGESQWYIIEDRNDADIERGELPKDHRLAQALIGKKPGDAIVLKQSIMSSEQGTITEIKSKYLHAFHESAKLLEVRYPEESSGFISMNLAKGEAGAKELIDKLKKQEGDRQKVARQADDLYRSNPFPIGAIARFLGCDIIQAWSHLCEGSESKVVCSSGAADERATAFHLLDAGVKLVIDPVALMTIHALKLADEIVAVVGRLGIAQATIDLLTRTLHVRGGISRKGFMTLTKQGDVHVRREVTEQQMTDYIMSLEALLQWVTSNCDVLPWPPSIGTRREERKELGEIIGEECLDTMLSATTPSCALFSDDLRLRQLANGDFGVDGLSTQYVLMRALDKGVIDRERYSRAVIQLATAGYVHTSVDAHVLLEAAKQSEWMVASPFNDVVALLSGSYCDVESAVRVAVEFLRLLWLQPMLPRSTDYLIMRLLDDLATDRDARHAVQRVRVAVSKRFVLLPIAENEVRKLIDAWQAIHLV